ncbi:hypothetical protein D9Q98_008108 [Chlorella vulgaris]|uniref:Histone deacetylase domain-containing protein n=1 Tax=Chlorella vulgaris TaxID=3077 RepID=A0A9D4YT32_CHLVU|nr:hypothetical protein D9Q98_008108 [Chlorella vulgaris]
MPLAYCLLAAPHHRFPNHPECPERVTAIEAELDKLQLGADRQVQHLTELPQQLPKGLLESVHTREHVNRLRATSSSIQAPQAVRDADDPDGPTFATPTSFDDALRAACAAVALVDAVAAGSSGNSSAGSSKANAAVAPSGAAAAAAGFSICRPPGHHATPDDQMGFCLLNNAALAARHAQRAHGLDKVMILDWDVHHGNGTQAIFWEDPSVLLVDIHQADVWPGSGGLEETGAGAGAGATINVPLPWHSGHAAAQQAFELVIAPAARRFKPDLLLISAGYDAHVADPLEHLQFQAATYHWLTSRLCELAAELCGGRLLLVLEGGYNQQALGECVAETVRALLGRPSGSELLQAAQLPHPEEPLEQVAGVLEQVRQLHGLA